MTDAVDPILTLLRKLSRRGAVAIATPSESGGNIWSIVVESDGSNATAEPLADGLAEQARARGLITCAAQGRWRLSRRGIAKLRGARGIGDGPSGSRMSAVAVINRTEPAPKQRPETRPRRAVPSDGSLEWLRNRCDASGRPLIDEIEYQAGLRLAADFEIGQMQPRVTQGWSGLPQSDSRRRSAPGQGVDISERAMAARARLRTALDDIGPDFANLALDICCFQIPLATVERDGGLPQRSAKVLLQFALRALARHYRMLPREPALDRVSPVRHWAREGYRPDAVAP